MPTSTPHDPAATAHTGIRIGRPRVRATIAVLAVAAAALTLVSAMLGQVHIPPQEVVGALLRAVGIDTAWAPDSDVVTQTLWVVRLPRVAMALVVGAALAVCGVVMQATFRNPLAEPGVVGVSSGAAVGASLAIVTGVAAFGGWTVAAFAFAGALGATLLVHAVAGRAGRASSVTLLLAGIAVNAFASAAIAFLLFAGNAASREQIVFWQLGSLNGSRWAEVGIVAVAAVVGTVFAWRLGRRYDLLALGERNARHLGVDTDRLRRQSILLTAVLTGAAIAFCGIIAFVGLVVPHIIRMALGPRHRALIVASALGGAVLLAGADLLARNLVSGADLPIGMLTSLIGGPFFFALLWRARRDLGAWQ